MKPDFRDVSFFLFRKCEFERLLLELLWPLHLAPSPFHIQLRSWIFLFVLIYKVSSFSVKKHCQQGRTWLWIKCMLGLNFILIIFSNYNYILILKIMESAKKRKWNKLWFFFVILLKLNLRLLQKEKFWK